MARRGAALAGQPATPDGNHPGPGEGTSHGQGAGPTAQDPHETHRENGKVRTEDGRAVRSDDGERNNRSDHQDASPEHSGEGGQRDRSSNPGSQE